METFQLAFKLSLLVDCYVLLPVTKLHSKTAIELSRQRPIQHDVPSHPPSALPSVCQTFYNSSRVQLKVSGNINMDQRPGCGIRNTPDNRLSGSHCIKLSSLPIWHYCGISTSDHGHTIFFPPLAA